MSPAGLRRAAGAAALLAGAFAAGWAAFRVGSASPPSAPPVSSSFRGDPPRDYEAATRPVRGALTSQARERLREAVPGPDAILVILRSRDCLVCEDLGRQLRELRRRAPERIPLIVSTETSGADVVRGFLRRERLRALVLGIAPAEVVEGDRALPTPAVLVLREGGASVAGVAHPWRFANTRLRSFAQELDSLLPPPDAAGGEP